MNRVSHVSGSSLPHSRHVRHDDCDDLRGQRVQAAMQGFLVGRGGP